MTDTTDEPPNGPIPAAGDPVATNVHMLRPQRGDGGGGRRWLAGGVVLVVFLIIGATLGLINRSDDDDRTLTSVSEPGTTVETTETAATIDVGSTVTTDADTTASTPPQSSDVVVTEETVDTTAPTDTVTPVDGDLQDYGPVATGQGIGSIKIEKIALSTFVVAGTGPDQLATAVGHLSSTPAPGQIGNAVLVGLRASQLAPFKELDQMRIGDVIEVDTSPGGTYFYRVTSAIVEEPTATHVITDTDDGAATLTLITCAPRGDTKQRLVVRASLVGELSSPPGDGVPNYGQTGDPPADSYEPCNMIPADVAATSTTS